MRKRVLCPHLLQHGDYFGENSLIYRCLTTAQITTITYCVCAKLERSKFDKLQYYAPDAYYNMIEATLKYDDEWIQFKIKLL